MAPTCWDDDGLPAAAGGALLVVDDDEANRDLLARRLERRGHAVATADGGPRALELIAGRRFDLVLLDVMMPGMSGLDVLRQVRRTAGPTELPVIMATARHQSEDIVEALRAGANDYVTKPLDFPVVLARINTQLAMKWAVDEAARLERNLAERNRELDAVNARLESANRRMARDLRAAAKVQGAFLPAPEPVLPGARCAWFYRPCEELAGDGLNAFPLDARRSGLYVFDVCGHGVASALLSVSLSRVLSPPGDPSSVLARAANGEPAGVARPAEVADALNRMFPFDQAEQYFTMIYGVLDVDPPGGGGVLQYVSAGHPGLIHLPAAGPVTAFDGRGFPVGLATGPYAEQALTLAPGDRVFFYSDGVPEAMDARGDPFGTERLLAALDRRRGLPLARSVEGLVGEVTGWSGGVGQRDDVSILAVEVGGSG